MNAIQKLNDDFRRTFDGGIVCLTSGVMALPEDDRSRLLNLVRTFEHFTDANDPYGEHDFGSILYNGETYYFKVDCYDLQCEGMSPDPANPAVTRRVMVIMHQSEY